MPFRDAIVIAIIWLSAPVALFNAYFGVLMWAWIAYFNPHRYAWGAIRHGFFLQPALIIAVPTLVGTLFAPKNTRIFVRETVLLAALWFWFAFTTFYISFVPEFAGHVSDANAHLQEVSKILLMGTFLTILLVNSRAKLRILVLVILASFGLKALFAAVFYLKTGGEMQVWGPEGSFIYDNNDFALAMNMTIPMFFFMARAESKLWMRVGLRLLMLCAVICVIGTYSRGGLVGLAAITLVLVAKSRQKIFGMVLVCTALLCIVTYTSLKWQKRMTDFLQGQLDQSANSRLVAWGGGWNLAMEYPLTGGGFDVYTDAGIFPSFVPRNLRGKLYGISGGLHSSHSVYFELLGEQGFVGLGLFILLIISCYGTLRRLRKESRAHSILDWVEPYTHMFEVTILAFLVNGITLGRAYFDFLYQIVALVIVLKILAARDLQSGEPETQPVEAMEAVAA
jgi:probable O-glycosylation ligase (exosortase A-associated)